MGECVGLMFEGVGRRCPKEEVVGWVVDRQRDGTLNLIKKPTI